MNLAGVEPNGAEASNYERHVILHEFGHSLGFLHEHQSPAREGVININAGKHCNINSSTCRASSNYYHFTACARYIQLEGWDDEMVDEHIRSQDSPLYLIASYSRLDPESVMMCVQIFMDHWSLGLTWLSSQVRH